MAGEHGTRHTMRAHNAQAVPDWLNPLSLGTMSASAYIDNSSIAYNSTCVINYQEFTRSMQIVLVWNGAV